jgi:hypothetical protein
MRALAHDSAFFRPRGTEPRAITQFITTTTSPFILLSHLNSLFFSLSLSFFLSAPFIPESHHFKTGEKSVTGNEVSCANFKLFIGK